MVRVASLDIMYFSRALFIFSWEHHDLVASKAFVFLFLFFNFLSPSFWPKADKFSLKKIDVWGLDPHMLGHSALEQPDW